MEDILDAWLYASRDRPFDLIIAGRTFGGRHGEAMLTPVAYQVVGPILVIRFQGAERLTVSDPRDVFPSEPGGLVIRDGTEARLAWFYYGRPQAPENLCEDIYRRVGEGLVFARTGPLSPTSAFLPYTSDGFVKLV